MTPSPSAPPQTTTPGSRNRGKRVGGVSARGVAWVGTQWESRKALEQCWGRKDQLSGLQRGRTRPQPQDFEEGRPQPKVSRSRGRQCGGVWDGLRDMRSKGPSTRIQAAQGLKAAGGHVV
ncbi:hypothetical protein CVT26_008419, partial [Gymnopilus dilepis]